MLLALGSALAGDVSLGGFVRPAFNLTVRDTPIPENQLRARLTSSAAGLIIQGSPIEQWSFRIYFLAGGRTQSVLTSSRPVDQDNDGGFDSVTTTTAQVLRDISREASVSWHANETFTVKAGQMPIPFTSNAQSSDTKLLFTERASPTGVFLADDDLGGIVQGSFGDKAVRTSLGLFNGTGINPDARGVLYLARVDIATLGVLSFDETDPSETDPQVSIGGGVMWHPYRTFDGAGYQRTTVNDLRATASARFAVMGFSAALEGLFRHASDPLTLRPRIAAGGYAQLGWLSAVGVEPIVRGGITVEDLDIAARDTVWTDLGMNYYPGTNEEGLTDRVKVTVAYQGEYRLTEGESAHGATAAVQLRFN